MPEHAAGDTDDKCAGYGGGDCTQDCKDADSCGGCCHEYRRTDGVRGKLECYNWLGDITSWRDCDLVEVQFKNTRKSFYVNSQNIPLEIGDIVVVEAQVGHDVGMVSMVGPLVRRQMKNASLRSDFQPLRIFRKAKPADMARQREAKSREHSTMIESRKIAESLGLDMKIGDVEYQGDGGKAVFYYIADERVDFRKLIRILADTFHVRIEMKQIGARQEAGRIGGIGPCGRPLCCATWMTRFASVGTSAARFQDLSMNPQKLAGQCAKLKCCLNFEVDAYMEAQRKIPHKDITLETLDATYYFFKADILRHEVTYSTAKNQPVNLVTIPASRAFEIISINKQGEKVESLEKEPAPNKGQKGFVDLVGQESLTRFDRSKKKKKKKGKGEAQPQQEKEQAKSKEQSKSPKEQPKVTTKEQSKESKEAKEQSRKAKEPQGQDNSSQKKQAQPGRAQRQKSSSRQPKKNHNRKEGEAREDGNKNSKEQGNQ